MHVTCQRATDKIYFVHTLFYNISNDFFDVMYTPSDVKKSLQLPIKEAVKKDILHSQSDWPGRRVSPFPGEIFVDHLVAPRRQACT